MYLSSARPRQALDTIWFLWPRVCLNYSRTSDNLSHRLCTRFKHSSLRCTCVSGGIRSLCRLGGECWLCTSTAHPLCWGGASGPIPGFSCYKWSFQEQGVLWTCRLLILDERLEGDLLGHGLGVCSSFWEAAKCIYKLLARQDEPYPANCACPSSDAIDTLVCV